MRAIVRGVLIANPSITAEIPASRVYGSGSVEGIPDRPFMEIRFGGTLRGVGRGAGKVTSRRIDVWVHDEEGSYTKIDKIIEIVKNTLESAVHVNGEIGSELIQVDWQSDSTDLYDDGYRTNCKYTSFIVIGKGA